MKASELVAILQDKIGVQSDEDIFITDNKVFFGDLDILLQSQAILKSIEDYLDYSKKVGESRQETSNA